MRDDDDLEAVLLFTLAWGLLALVLLLVQAEFPSASSIASSVGTSIMSRLSHAIVPDDWEAM